MTKDGSKRDYDPVVDSSGSPSEMSFSGEPSAPSAPQKSSQMRSNIIKCSGVLIVLIILALLTQGGHTGVSLDDLEERVRKDAMNFTGTLTPFKYMVHCPVSYFAGYLNRLIEE